MRNEGKMCKTSFGGVARQPGRGRGRYHMLSRLPSDQEQKRESASGNSDVTIIPLFEKVLSASDVQHGRMILPRSCAETYFPAISQPKGLLIEMMDKSGNMWVPKFSFWRNKEARIYFLQGLKACIHSMELQAGDTVTFSRLDPVNKLLIGPRVGRYSSQVDAKQRESDVDETAEASLSEDEDSVERLLLLSETSKRCHAEYEDSVQHTIGVASKRFRPEKEDSVDGIIREKTERRRSENGDYLDLTFGRTAKRSRAEKEDSLKPTIGKTAKRRHSENEDSVDRTVTDNAKRCRPENGDSVDRLIGQKTERCRSENEDPLELTLGRAAKRRRAEKEDSVRPTLGKTLKQRHSENEEGEEGEEDQENEENEDSVERKRCGSEDEDDSLERALGGKPERRCPENEDSVERILGETAERSRTPSEDSMERSPATTARRCRTPNEDSKEMYSWKEAQELLRPPPLVVPTIVTIEGHDFEAYSVPPVLTKPTVFTLRQSGEQDQWAECDQCGNWRRIPADAVIPARWTCSENSWDKGRASCSVPQETNSDEIIFR